MQRREDTMIKRNKKKRKKKEERPRHTDLGTVLLKDLRKT